MTLSTSSNSSCSSTNLTSTGSKRCREDEPFPVEWTEEEIDLVQAVLLHPYKPLSQPFPPGVLPPGHIIDEIANQILAFAFRPTLPSRQLRHLTDLGITSSTQIDASQSQLSPPGVQGQDGSDEVSWNGHWEDHWVEEQEAEEDRKGWRHGFTDTRKKVYELALADSKWGHDQAERKLSRLERKMRPGLRRMDSMDFLDEEEGQTGSLGGVGKALRLSTSLQNSAKQETLLPKISRSNSLGGILERASTPPLPPPPATITLTPASPQRPGPSLRRQGSFRAPRVSRPSLLQRGRSFTASDLQEEANAAVQSLDSPPAATSPKSPASPTPVTSLLSHPTSSSITDPPNSVISNILTESPTKDQPDTHMTSPELLAVPPQLLPHEMNLSDPRLPRLTRSQSSSAAMDRNPSLCSQFLSSPKPTTGDRSMLAKPLSLDMPPPAPRGHGGWSDSDDEGLLPATPRVIKKVRPARLAKNKTMRVVKTDQVLMAGGLRSPFEEKDIQF
ncbi:hypothetical protein M231_01171 [Tremella mesenterica]|uniref:Uncharacterized protein n=1 Tax=Tremella mesenterica TaxID=5217 RepID=A0A4Q1BTQ1_TREME|nr:hypothetical protein M231_01171 [Tremella mesenterica]